MMHCYISRQMSQVWLGWDWLGLRLVLGLVRGKVSVSVNHSPGQYLLPMHAMYLRFVAHMHGQQYRYKPQSRWTEHGQQYRYNNHVRLNSIVLLTYDWCSIADARCIPSPRLHLAAEPANAREGVGAPGTHSGQAAAHCCVAAHPDSGAQGRLECGRAIGVAPVRPGGVVPRKSQGVLLPLSPEQFPQTQENIPQI